MSKEKLDTEMDRPRLKIQGDLPIRTVGIETERERTNYSDLPPQNYIHVWWARRPTPATRLAILGSVLPDGVDDDELLRWMGINPNNITDGTSISEHVRIKKRTEDQRDGLLYEHFGYRKSYKNLPSREEKSELHDVICKTWGGTLPTILDATAGGGSIPFESVRYEFPTIANELNPVASVILKAVLEHPRVDGDLSNEIRTWGERINESVRTELSEFFPSKEDERILEYIWANTVQCPDCGLELPLSPTWWLEKETGSEGIAARPEVQSDRVKFSIVEMGSDVEKSDFNPTNGTISRGKATCLNCSVTIASDEIKRQAKNGQMADQLFAIHYQSMGKGEERQFRVPNDSDLAAIDDAVREIETDIGISTLLNEDIPYGEETARLEPLGILEWRDMYSDRQLLTHYTYWQTYENLKEEILESYPAAEAEAILTFLAIAADKAV